MDTKYNLSTLKRGLKALTLLNARGAMTVGEIAAEMKLARTTARRVFDTLLEEGYVEKSAGEHKYRITPMVNMLSSGFSDESWIAHVAEPLLVAKTSEIGWPLGIATAAGPHVMVRVSTDRLTPLSLDHYGIGFKTPMMYGTSGQVILAHMSARHRELVLRILRNSPDPRQSMARNEDQLRAMIKTVKAQGYSNVLYREYPEASVAVPIFHQGAVRAALFMVYEKSSINTSLIRGEYAPALRALAAQIQSHTQRGTRALSDLASRPGRLGWNSNPARHDAGF